MKRTKKLKVTIKGKPGELAAGLRGAATRAVSLHRYVLAVERSATAVGELVLDLELGLVSQDLRAGILGVNGLRAPTRQVLRGITEDLRVMVRRLRELRGRVATDLDPRRGVR